MARTTLGERIHFDYDMAEIRPDAERVLRAKLGILRASPAVQLRIEQGPEIELPPAPGRDRH